MVCMYFSAPAKDEAVWLANCGRGVHHLCSWPPPWLQLELPKSSSPAVQGDEKSSSSPAVQEQAQSRPAVIKKTAYAWAGSSLQSQRNLSQFIIQACDSLWPIVTKPIASCSDYVERVDEACKALPAPSWRRVPVFHAHDDGPWLLQALLMAQLHCCGVKALAGTAAVSTMSFNQAVPDQGDWVEHLSSHADWARARSQRTFQDFLDYAGLSSEPPEYSSMCQRIWGTNLLPEDTAQQFSKDHAEAHALAPQYKIQNGTWLRPLTFLEKVAAGQKPASSSPAVQGPATSCPAVQGPVTTAEPATSSYPAPGAAGPMVKNCIMRDGALQKCPASVRKCECQ